MVKILKREQLLEQVRVDHCSTVSSLRMDSSVQVLTLWGCFVSASKACTAAMKVSSGVKGFEFCSGGLGTEFVLVLLLMTLFTLARCGVLVVHVRSFAILFLQGDRSGSACSTPSRRPLVYFLTKHGCGRDNMGTSFVAHLRCWGTSIVGTFTALVYCRRLGSSRSRKTLRCGVH